MIAAHSAGAELILLTGSDSLERELRGMPDAIRSRFADGTPAQIGVDVGTVILLKQAAAKKLQALTEGSPIEIVVKVVGASRRATYNAIGFLPGTDPGAGTILLTAHLDHLGEGRPVNGDPIYNGADDDASGTTAVLELARVLSGGEHLKRSLLFVCFGSEELGGCGSAWFGHHLPIPLNQVVADLNLEQVGLQDPKMPNGVLMVNGWERSDLGRALREHGARLGPDPYPEMHLFEASDNFGLARQGVIAHTLAGYALPPNHHQPDDDFTHLDFPFMTAAIESLVEPIRWLANSDFRPKWNSGLKP